MAVHKTVDLLQTTAFLLCCLYLMDSASSDLIRFKPLAEYIYTFHSNSELKSVRNITANAKVGLIVVQDISDIINQQEIYLRIHTATITSGDQSVRIDDEKNLENWFSFEISSNGLVKAVFYPTEEDPEVVAIKKGVISILSASLQRPLRMPQSEDGGKWRYQTNETGQEGQHMSAYEAHHKSDGIISFKKTRITDPFQHGESHHEKEVNVHNIMQIPTHVKTREHINTFASAPSNFDPYEGLGIQESSTGERLNIPEIKAVSEGQMTFVKEVPRRYALTRPPSDQLITDTLHIKGKPMKKPSDEDIKVMLIEIRGNLTCMRESSNEESSEVTDCFVKLLRTLERLPDDSLLQVVHTYLSGPRPRKSSARLNRQYMVDALGSLKNHFVQDLLADLVLRAPAPDVSLVDRALVQAVGKEYPPSLYFVDVVEDMVFNPTNFKVLMDNRDMRRTAVLVLGALAGNLWEAGHIEEAESIVSKIELNLEIHDPWEYLQRTQHLQDDEKTHHHLDTMAWIEALGNAALQRSFEHIHSYTNTSSTPPDIKRAGLHSLRGYHHDKTGDILLSAATQDPDDNVRYEAGLLYRAHPHGKRQDYSTATNGSVCDSTDPMDPINTCPQMIHTHHHRSKRSIFDGIKFTLKSPSYDWKKVLGGDECGASFGLTIRNQLDLDISPLSGSMKVDCFDEAFARIHLGMVGLNIDMFVARFCFKGHAEYNLNILQEFSVDKIAEFAKVYDLIVEQVIGNIGRGVETFQKVLSGSGDFSVGKLFENLGDAIENIPPQIEMLRYKGVEAMKRLMRLDPSDLPPSIISLRDTIRRAVNLFNDIRTDIMEFYQAVSEAITVTLPWAAEMMWDSVEAIVNSIGDLFSSPKTAIGAIFKGVTNIKMAVDAILEAKNKTEEASFFLEANRPYWWDLPTVLKEIQNELITALGSVRQEMVDWVKEVASAADPVKKLTGGAFDMQTLRNQIKQEVEEIVKLLSDPLEPLKTLLDPFVDIYSKVYDAIKAVKEAYQILRNGYREAKSLIDQLFGPKVHRRFPREYRLTGGGCESDGFYPTDTGGFYDDQGVDLLIDEGSPIVSPFAGSIQLTCGNPNQVELRATGGSFRNTVILITNIQPNSTISERTLLRVSKGQLIGHATQSQPCSGPYNHIHFAIKKSNRNRLSEVLSRSKEDDDDEEDEDVESQGYLDPSSFLESRAIETPEWIQECDDYKLVFKGKTVKAGSVLGGSKGKKQSTSPARKPQPDATTTPLDSAFKPTPPPLNQITSTAMNLPTTAKEETRRNLGLPTLLPGNSPFKGFSIRNLKIGSILAFLDRLGLDQTKQQLVKVIKAVKDLISNKPCVLPESLTDEQLKRELQERGVNASGSRDVLITRYRQPEDRCPLLLISLPKNIYCKLDPSCLGLECCLNIKLFMVSMSFKAYMRIDPCQLEFVMGLNTWSYTQSFKDLVEWEIEKEVVIPFELPFVDDTQLVLRFGIQKTLHEILVSMATGFCSKTNTEECLVFVDILKDSVIMLPVCHPNGTITWPDINIKDYFSRDALKNRLKEIGQDVVSSGIDVALRVALKELNLPQDLLDGGEPCLRPQSLSDSALQSLLTERSLDLGGTRLEKEQRITLDDRSCSVLGKNFTLPALPSSASKVAYMTIGDNCLKVEVCLTIKLPGFHRSFRAFVEIDPCQFTYSIGFESLKYHYLLFSYDWGQPESLPIGAITIGYAIDKLEDEKVFSLSLSAKVCPDPQDCVFDIPLVQDHRIPIPLCNNDFSLSLPGGFSASEFIKNVGRNAASSAVKALFDFIGLSDKVAVDETCDRQGIIERRGDCFLSLPSLANTLTCAFSDHCLGVHCCMEIDLEIVTLSTNNWLVLDPCEFVLSLGFGKWSLNLTLFDYHWGSTQTINIGSAVKATYTIDKLSAEKVFVIDFAFSVCLPDDDTCLLPSLDVLKKIKVPIPFCNANFSLSLPGGSISEFAKQVGKSAGQAAVEAVLRQLEIDQYVSTGVCERPQVVQNGWNRACPKTITLPKLPSNMVCKHHEKCLGFDCCVDLDIKVTTLSTRFWFILDPCQYEITMGLGMWSYNVSIFSYDWGKAELLSIGEPLQIGFSIDKRNSVQSFEIDLNLKFCIDEECIYMEVLQGSLVPIPFCNLNASFTLPGDGSIAGFAKEIGKKVGAEAVQAVLRKLGLEEFVSDTECAHSQLAPKENVCPLIKTPPTSNILSCTVADKCLGISCCVTLDLKVTSIYLSASILIDPCEFVLAISFGKWSLNITLLEFSWGTTRQQNLGSAIELSYTINKLDKDLEISVNVDLCIDENCESIPVLEQTIVPIPLCNDNFTLPGDGSFNGYLQELAETAAEASVDLVLKHFGLEVFLSTDSCHLPSSTGESCASINLPNLPSSASCQLDPQCLGIQCCLNLDFHIAQIATKTWLLLDPCDYELSIGLGSWYLNISLFSYSWGMEEVKSIGSALSVSYTISKLDALKSYQVDLLVQVNLDGIITDIPMMQGTQIPIPLCNQNFTLSLPGDGTISGFLTELGNNVGQTAIDLVLEQLGLKDYISGKQCLIQKNYQTCPTVNVPFFKDHITCAAVNEHCLGVQCCVNIDFKIAKLMQRAWITLDPCNYQFSIGFENWSYNGTLFTYSWGKQEYFKIGSFMALSFAIDKTPQDKVFSVDLGARLCIDGLCTDISILEAIRLPIPLCNIDPAAYQLPGNGTVAGFVQHLGGKVGDSAVELVLQKFGLEEYLYENQCQIGLPGSISSDCPAIDLPTLPSYASCEIMSSCLAIQCCLEVDLKITQRFLTAWVILDPCSLWFSIGMGKWSTNVTLIDYPMGEVREVTIGEVLQVRWSLDKSPSENVFQVDISLQICIEGECVDSKLLDQARLPIPVCNANAPITPPEQTEVEYSSELVVDRLGISADLLLPTPCDALPLEIIPTQTDCPSIMIPSGLTSYCAVNQSCQALGCCLEMDLGVTRRFFSIWMRLDPCGNTFALGFENWVYTESLNAGFHFGIDHNKDIGHVTLRYRIMKPSATLYHIDLSVMLCLDGVCNPPITIVHGAMISVSDCSGLGRRRRRRQAEESEPAADEKVHDDSEAISLDNKVRKYFKGLLDKNITTISAESNMMTTLDPGRKVPYKTPEGPTSRRQMGVFVLQDEEMTKVPRNKRDLAASSGTEDTFGLKGSGTTPGMWQGLTVVGGGLTDRGADALNQKIANMTIGELEAMLDLQNIDPLLALKLMKELKQLFSVIIEEVIDAFTSGDLEDAFSSFDVKLAGTIPFPRRELRFFEFSYGQLLGGLLYVKFRASSDGYFGLSIPVSVSLLTMKAEIGLQPRVGASVNGGVAIGNFIYGELELKAQVLYAKFPTVAELTFAKFPLDVGIRMDMTLIPIKLQLYAKLTIDTFLFGRKTLLSIRLWHYSAPALESTVFDIHTKDPDKSPPQIMETTSGGSTRGVLQPGTTRKCKVEQVPGLDYTEPAFQLEVAASDDKSQVTFTYSVGTAPGGRDVVEEEEFGGPSAIIAKKLRGGIPLYFTVTARNSGGGTATATCSLSTYDLTPPTGRIDPAFRSTSHPYILKASAVVYDDSDIISQQEAVGFGGGVWGDQMVPWADVDKRMRTNSRSGGSALEQFTTARNGRLATNPLSSSKALSTNSCAQKCLDASGCLSFNYDTGKSSRCEILDKIEGHDASLHKAGNFHHFERLGLGHAIEFTHDSVSLSHNSLYYYNLQLLNYVGYQNIITSPPILADFTPPSPGALSNVIREELTHEPCTSFVHRKWQSYCVTETPLDNHRVIIDGLGSLTVFNGDEDLVDTLYTKSNSFLSANWDGFHDNETGILGYMWAVGSDVCLEDVVGYQDPHSHLYDMSEWTHEGLVTGLSLPDGFYYSSVRALNNIEFGGPMALTVCHSTPLVIDNTVPFVYAIFNVTYDSSLHLIGTNVNATDPESGLSGLHFALGRTPRDVSLLGWILFPAVKFLNHIFQIPDGTLAWVKIRAINNVDLRASKVADYPILVDFSPPVAGDIYDGPIFWEDLKFTKGRQEICGNWRNFYDPQSGISLYQWGVGTQPGWTDTLDPVDLSSSTHKYCGQVTLQHNVKYYTTLVAVHGGSDKLNVTASSNGVTVDLTPPESGELIDGTEPGFTDIHFSSEPATVKAQWENYTDPESDIRDYKITVYRKKDSVIESNKFEVIHPTDSVGPNATSIEWHHFHLHHKDQVYVTMETTNGALDSIESSSDGYLVDLTAPKLLSIGDGERLGVDKGFQTHSDSISVNWQYYDDESGIDHYKVAIFEMWQGSKHKIFPADGNPHSLATLSNAMTTSHTQQNLALRSGAVYTSVVKAVNHAKLVASHETTGIRVDTTPPVMDYVRAGSLDGEEEELHNGYVYQSDLNGIQASWLASDGQSDVGAYLVTVVSNPEETDMATYLEYGKEEDGYITGLTLNITDSSTCSDEEFTPDCQPVYYVCVKAENGAGAYSGTVCSSPIRVVQADQVGYLVDGPGSDSNTGVLLDIDAQLSTTTITVQFTGFASTLHGLSHYEWSVGSKPGAEDVQVFTQDGIVYNQETPDAGPGLAGSGEAQSPLPLQHGRTYYSTLRAVTGAGDVLEAVSDGLVVDNTPPNVYLIQYADYTATGNLSLALDSGKQLYHNDPNTLTATWEVNDDQSKIDHMYYGVGQYPGDDSIYEMTTSDVSYIPASVLVAAPNGIPNLLSIEAVNTVGLTGQLFSTSLAIDTTPPSEGKVVCPKFLAANDVLKCTWSGFHDPESGIDYYRLYIGTEEGYHDVYRSPKITARTSSYAVPDLNLAHNKQYYITIEASNYVDQQTRAYSKPVVIDDTHPVSGVVVELSGVYRINDTVADSPWRSVNCSNAEDCLKSDIQCVQSLSEVAIAWEPFKDPETQITRYEIGLGITQGGSQIKSFYQVSADKTSEVINIDLMGARKIYATVRGYNEAGLSSISTSNGAYVSHYGAGVQPIKPFVVRDGVQDTGDVNKDLDFQTSSDQLSASWDFSGDPCPIAKYEWAVYRIDGEQVQDWVDVDTRTSASTDEVSMKDGETYYAVVRATNVMGLTLLQRSDGVRVQRDPLIPGRVYDGALIGKDLNYQQSVMRLSANWDGFGGNVVAENIKHTGNEEIKRDSMGVQDVDFYEVAIGTDRRYPNTRDNVVPFTKVGQNKTVTFDNLDLQPLTSVYYVTVRAHSASFASAETTSNGMTAGVGSTMKVGDVNVDRFVNSLTKVEIAWDSFESVLPILLYYVGICNSSEAVQQLHCRDIIMSSASSELQRTDCGVFAFTDVGKDTYKQATNLTLQHGMTYYTAVIGLDEAGLCNISSAEFTVDVTSPIEGRIRTGPFYDLSQTYSESAEYVSVWWEGYQDHESLLELYRLRLLRAQSCSDCESDDSNLQVEVDWITIGASNTEYRFMDIDLQSNKPYYVELQAVNGAGSTVVTRSAPILVDSSEPTPGFVVDGTDFTKDETHHGNTQQVSGTFLHLANPNGPSCPERQIKFSEDSIEQSLNTQGLWTMSGNQWKLKYDQDQVEVTEGILGITLERDTMKDQLLSAAYAIDAAIQRGGDYMIDIKAASGDVNAITSVVFWDGPSGVVGDYIMTDPVDWQGDICSCCFVKPFNASLCWCNCTEYQMLSGYNDANSAPGSSPSDGTTEKYEHSVDNMMQSLVEQRACGLQLHYGESGWQATIWCRYHRDNYLMIHDTVPLQFDPSQEMHSYSFSIKAYPTVADQEQWELSLLVDGILLTALDGIPQLSTSTQLIMHVWNKDNIVMPLMEEFRPPKVTAYFGHLRIPPETSHPCRYGNPFRAGTSPIVGYLAGIGTMRGEVDVLPFTEIARLCIPCLSSCDRFQCSDSCDVTQVTPVSFTFKNLTLPATRPEYADVANNTVANAAYFLTVQAVLGNGKTASASSSGVYIDITPPRFDIQFYLDVTRSNISELEPVTYQASNSTIKAYWNFIDEESELKAFYWAIGTSKGATDLQNFTFVGLNQTNSNSNLEGLLYHNHTYYITVKAVNGAGLEKITECDGVTVLLKEPQQDSINTTLQFSEPVSDDAYPRDAMKTNNAHSTGISWTKSEDESVARYDYCVGSSEEAEDDIVQCVTVGVNSSGSVAIKDGRIVVSNTNDVTESDISDLKVPDEDGNVDTRDRFNMEPGKCLHTKLKVCNAADICTIKSAGTTTVIEDGDELMSSSSGEDLEIRPSGSRRRKRQAGQDDFELAIKTSGGLHAGGSLLFGFLDGDRVSQDYTSDASVSYKSYITDHSTMAQHTSRLLRGRILEVFKPSFFVGSLGQVELQGPLFINVTFSSWGDWQEEIPKLVYWDSELTEWRDAGVTCEGKLTTYQQDVGMATVPVCATQKPHEARTTQGIYFSHETQFVVAKVTTTVPNEKPYFVNLPSNITLNEDEGIVEYQLLAKDANGDNIKFVLDLNYDPPRLGNVSLTTDGLLTYVPCQDCNGQEIIHLKVEEVQNLEELVPLVPLTTEGSIEMIIRAQNDNPFVFISYQGELANSRNTKKASLQAEQNIPANLVYAPITATIGAYDIDLDDHVTLSISQPANGNVEIATEVYSMPANVTDCGVIVDYAIPDREEMLVPCGIRLPYNKVNLAWVMSTVTYHPKSGFHGKDNVVILAHDRDGAASQLLTVDIDVTAATCILDPPDSLPPEIFRKPGDITQTNDPGLGTASVIWTGPVIKDNCDAWTATSTSDPGDNFPIGNTTVVVTATDTRGNSAKYEFTVTVKDIDAPIFHDPDSVTIATDPGEKTVETWTPRVTDNSGTYSVTLVHASGEYYHLGSNNVTFTAVDEMGNSVTKSFTVIVVDREAPVFDNLVSDISVNAATGQSYAQVTWTNPQANDNTGGFITISSDYQPGSTFNVGETTVTYTAVDQYGNEARHSFTVTVNDKEAPYFLQDMADITVNTDPGQATAQVTWTNPHAADHASPSVTVRSDIQSGSYFNIGHTTVTITAEDQHGNRATQSFAVTVNDGENPVFTFLPSTIIRTLNPGTFSESVTWEEPRASDNSGFYTVTSSHQNGYNFPIGDHYVNFVVRDPSGHSAEHSMLVRIRITCPSTDWKDYNNNCYFFSSTTLSYFSAEEGCLIEDAALTSILTNGEHDFLKGIVQTETIEFWIGLTDYETEGNYKWSDLSAYEPSNAKWDTGEPNDNLSGEDCVEIGPDGNWNDENCDSLRKYICKKPYVPVRLVGGSGQHEGRVEVFSEGEWGTVCNDHWDLNDAHVICKQLGFSKATHAIDASDVFGAGTGPIFLDDVACTANTAEESIFDCPHTTTHNCDHTEDAGVICY